ncbi:MAG TPA: hypothetical protein VNM24_05085 [Burkholderiales bacterium]|jgi:hypothetical protein|nr:hypothetical protein [Burkholderiales bacterium]
MNPIARVIGQVVLYGLFAAALGYFSTSPNYTHLAPDQALVKVSFTHTAQHIGACRRRSDEELAKLPPNMRIREECPRERAPTRIELEMDGALLYSDVLQPSGLSRDGATSVYRRFPVPAGRHRFEARLSDIASGEFNHQREESLELAPAQILLVDFDARGEGLVFRR